VSEWTFIDGVTITKSALSWAHVKQSLSYHITSCTTVQVAVVCVLMWSSSVLLSRTLWLLSILMTEAVARTQVCVRFLYHLVYRTELFIVQRTVCSRIWCFTSYSWCIGLPTLPSLVTACLCLVLCPFYQQWSVQKHVPRHHTISVPLQMYCNVVGGARFNVRRLDALQVISETIFLQVWWPNQQCQSKEWSQRFRHRIAQYIGKMTQTFKFNMTSCCRWTLFDVMQKFMFVSCTWASICSQSK